MGDVDCEASEAGASVLASAMSWEIDVGGLMENRTLFFGVAEGRVGVGLLTAGNPTHEGVRIFR